MQNNINCISIIIALEGIEKTLKITKQGLQVELLLVSLNENTQYIKYGWLERKKPLPFEVQNCTQEKFD